MEIPLTGSWLFAKLVLALWSLLACAAGCVVTSRAPGAFFSGERILIGLTTGVVLSTLVSFLLSIVFGISTVAFWLSPLLVLLVAWIASRKTLQFSSFLKASFRSRTDRFGAVVLITSMLFFWLFADRLVMWNSGALATGIIDNWGDLPFHLGIITSFLTGGQVPPSNPSFAGHPLVYPFLSDFLSAMLINMGVSLEYAIEFPNIVLNSVAMTLLFYLSYRLVRHRGAAALAPLLFVLAGGLGFLWFLSDLYLANTPVWELINHLPKRYTNLGEEGIRWINPTLAHLLPQRSFLFGFPLVLSICILLWSGRSGRKEGAFLPGLLTGLLPFSHMHSFMALMMAMVMMGGADILRDRGNKEIRGYWVRYFGTAAIVAIPQLLFFLFSRVDAGSAIRFAPGWMAGEENLIWFWLKNTGAIIPLMLVALLFRRSFGLRSASVRFVVPFFLLFVIGNLFLFSPIAYDTNKIFIFSFLLGMPFVAMVLVRMFRSPSWWVHGFAFRTLLVVLVFSGVLNLVHELQSGGWQEFSATEIDVAARIRRDTPEDAVFLSAPVHNTLVMLSGRPVVLGYPSHVYSHGVDPAAIEDDVKRMYGGGDDAENLLKSHGVDFVLVGPGERSRFGNVADWFQQKYPAFLRVDQYTVYRIQ